MYLCILYLLFTLQKLLMAKTLNSLCIIHLHLSQERRKICYSNDFENILYIFYKTCINRVPEESGHFVKAAYVLLAKVSLYLPCHGDI